MSERDDCPNCWKGETIACAAGCRAWNECCDKQLGVPCPYCLAGARLAGEISDEDETLWPASRRKIEKRAS